MARAERDYYKMFIGLCEFPRQALDFLKYEMENFDGDGVTTDKLDQLHEIENAADRKKHELIEKLVKEFVTPIEREDIMLIAETLDELTDNIEEFYQKLFMFHVKELRPEVIEFLNIIEECLQKVYNIYVEFANYKKSSTIYKEIIDLNILEEEGDLLYITSIRRVFGEDTEPVDKFVWNEIFEHLEKCCDLCEQAGNLVEEVIMKNS